MLTWILALFSSPFRKWLLIVGGSLMLLTGAYVKGQINATSACKLKIKALQNESLKASIKGVQNADKSRLDVRIAHARGIIPERVRQFYVDIPGK